MKKKKEKLKIIPAGKTKINGITVYTPQVTVDPKYEINVSCSEMFGNEFLNKNAKNKQNSAITN